VGTGNDNVNDYYTILKDSNVGLNWCSVDIDVVGEASFMGHHFNRKVFASAALTFAHLYHEWYIMPDFSELQIEKDQEKLSATINCTPTKGVLFPLSLGIGLYDNEGKLILIERKHPSGYEFIFHDGNSEIGIQYDNNKRVRVVTECKFYSNGRIKTYERFECEPRGVVRSYDREGYEYFEDSMIVECTDYFVYQDIQTMRHDIMHFTIEDGYLTQYINKSYVDGELMDTPANDWVWKVYIKRKVP
jgi:hypothetical protein